MRLLVICFFLLIVGSVVAVKLQSQEIMLEISGHALMVEIANTQELRTQGLMYREVLEENSGMLFIFPRLDYYSMWMKNTFIPLSVAFIDEKGFILNIIDMQPESLEVHESTGMAKYALETNVGWFSERKIIAGTRVIGLEKAFLQD